MITVLAVEEENLQASNDLREAEQTHGYRSAEE
jgi:hypothetical protein